MKDFLGRTFAGIEKKAARERPLIPDNTTSWGGLRYGDAKWGGSYSLDKGLKDGYEVWEVVRACVDTISNHASGIPWRVSKFSSEEAKKWFEWEKKTVPAPELADFHRYWRMSRGLARIGKKKVFELEPQPNHPLENLIEHPNDFMGRKFIIEIMVQHLLLAGNALLIKTRRLEALANGTAGPTGAPMELWPIYPDEQRIEVVPDEKQYIREYRYKPDSFKDPIVYSPADVVHAMLPNPKNFRWGSPLLKSGLRTLRLDKDAASWQKNMFENMGVPQIGISYEKDLDRQKHQEVLALLKSQFFGVDNAREPLVVGNAAKFQQLSLSAAELDFIESRKISARMICVLHRVDPRMIALVEQATDMTSIHRNHWTNLMVPLLERFQAVFEMYLAPEFGKDVLPWFDTANVDAFREELHKKVQTAKIMWSWGEPRDEINRRLNLGLADHIDGGEHGYYPASAVRWDQLDAQAQAAIAAMEALKEAHENGDLAAQGQQDQEGGSGNTNTPPDGGDPGTSGNQNDDQPDDASKQDSGKQAASLSTRWIKEHAELWLEEERFEVHDYQDEDNHHAFIVTLWQDKRPLEPEGVEVEWGPINGQHEVRFYHGEMDDRVAYLHHLRYERWAHTAGLRESPGILSENGVNH